MVREHLSFPATQLFVRKQLGNRIHLGTETLWEHSQRVAAVAERAAVEHYLQLLTSYIPIDRAELVTDIAHAALMHELVERCGCSYEQLYQETNLGAASLVCAVSRDNRRPHPQRHSFFRMELANQRELPAQLVVLADIVCTLKSVQRIFLEDNTQEMDRLVDFLGTQLFGDLQALTAMPAFGILHTMTKTASAELVSLVDSAKQRTKGRFATERVLFGRATRRRKA